MKYLFGKMIIIFLFGFLVGYFVYRHYTIQSISGFIVNRQNNHNTNNMRKNNEESVVRRKTSLSVSSFITPHHLVADKLIENIFSEVARQNKRQKIDRVILVSPNHFNVGQGEIIVADNSLLGEGNNFRVDKVGLQKLLAIDFVHKDANAFYKEHGIKGLLPFVQKYFPDTAVINLMIKDGTSAEKMKRLARVVSGLEGETLVILSSDFSHYLSSSISRWHDRKAVDIISHFDYPAVYNLETDCTPGLYFLMKFSELQNYKQFVWVNNSNSSKILGGDFVGENTSYVTGYFSKNNKSREKNIISQASRLTSILFFGDLMLDRHNRTLMNEKGVGYFTEKIERLFWGQDLNVVNLEGPITKNKSLSLGMPVENPNHFRFTFNPEQAINFLQANRINLVNIGNNHILNFHNDGLKQTEEFLKKGGINYFGNPTDLEKMFVIKNVNNHQIAFVSYNRFGKFTVADTIKIIREIRDKVDFIIVYTHWGQEYKLVENEKQTAKAHQFIDAGADLIIGSHPHVVQPIEVYKNKAIFYSLGNFVFDQYFSENVKSILGVGISQKDDKVNFILIPLYMQNNGQLELMSGEQKQKFLQSLLERSKMSNDLKTSILKDEQFELTQ